VRMLASRTGQAQHHQADDTREDRTHAPSSLPRARISLPSLTERRTTGISLPMLSESRQKLEDLQRRLMTLRGHL
jgi:hypothetical protein